MTTNTPEFPSLTHFATSYVYQLFFGLQVLITKLRSANTLETEQYRKATKALLVLIPLLGITNLLVLCGPSDDSWFAHAFDYTRALMLSTQVIRQRSSLFSFYAIRGNPISGN